MSIYPYLKTTTTKMYKHLPKTFPKRFSWSNKLFFSYLKGAPNPQPILPGEKGWDLLQKNIKKLTSQPLISKAEIETREDLKEIEHRIDRLQELFNQVNQEIFALKQELGSRKVNLLKPYKNRNSI